MSASCQQGVLHPAVANMVHSTSHAGIFIFLHNYLHCPGKGNTSVALSRLLLGLKCVEKTNGEGKETRVVKVAQVTQSPIFCFHHQMCACFGCPLFSFPPSISLTYFAHQCLMRFRQIGKRS